MKKNQRHSPFRGNPYFEQYLHLLIRLHTAMRNNDESEAEMLREQMDLPANHLDSQEIQWVKGVSADLYMLAGDEDFRLPDRSQHQLILDLKAASETADGETMLVLLRQASFISSEHRAWFRSKAYESLGYFSLSQFFLAFAIDQAPNNFRYKYMLLAKFLGQGDFANAQRLALNYSETPDLHPMLRILIAIVLYQSTEALPRDQAAPFLRRALDVLNLTQTSELGTSDKLMYWMIIGYCEYRLGHVDEAITADNQAISMDPTNVNALEARGRHRLREDYTGALNDFQAAVRLGTLSPYPYLFVIREQLVRSRYEEAVPLCNHLLEQSADQRVQTQAYEFLANALYGSGRPFSEVQKAYIAALELAPSPRLRQNYQDLTVANMGVISHPHLILPLLSVEEAALELDGAGNNAESENSQFEPAGTSIYANDENTLDVNSTFPAASLLSPYLGTNQQRMLNESFFSTDLLLAA